MVDKNLRKLSRFELLEMLLEKSREADRLQKENEELRNYIKEIAQKENDNLKQYIRERLDERRITIENAGSIAEAALQLNNIFELAQKAADQYVKNVKLLCEDKEAKLSGCEKDVEKTELFGDGDSGDGTD